MSDYKKCPSCNSYERMHNGFCYDCNEIEEEGRKEYDHTNAVVCPKCKHVMNVFDLEFPSLYDEGVHDVSCNDCDTSISVSTNVTYNFCSSLAG